MADGMTERETHVDHLATQRRRLVMKCAGLTPDQLTMRSVPPSTMSLLGMIRHLAEVERHWFRRRLDGGNPDYLYGMFGKDVDWDGAIAEPSVVEDAWAAWRDEVAFGEAWLDAHDDLGATVDDGHGGRATVRGILVHVIEEYAQHMGHADLLRERIDGRTRLR